MTGTLSSFFSGIGGFDLGFQKAGFEINLQVENNDYCNDILCQRWPEVKRYGDIRTVQPSDVPVSDVWAGGFPCQDVSVARMGPRAGLRGKQSGLFYDFARLLDGCRPRVLVIENVPGLLSSHGGRDFEIVIGTLAKLGYGVGWRVLNSRYFGVPQSRQRVFIVGCYRDWRGPGEILFESECGPGDNSKNRSNGQKAVSPFKKVTGDPVKGPLVPDMAYCLYACSARHTGTDWSRNYVSYPDGRVRRLLPVECERIQGFPEGWTIPQHLEESVDADRIDSLRYHALGNAVTVAVAEWLGRRIGAYLGEQTEGLASLRATDTEAFDMRFSAALG